jgi:hypothetical protein
MTTLRRTDSAIPTTPGWHYAMTKVGTIEPHRVRALDSNPPALFAVLPDGYVALLPELRWFGPVPQVEVATTDAEVGGETYEGHEP